MDTQFKPIYDTRAYGEDDEMSQTDFHNDLIDYMASVIRLIFSNQVMGIFKSINLYGDPLNPNIPKSPDLLAIDGVLQDSYHENASYYIGPDNAPPRFLLEVASDSTWPNDVGDKVQVYQRMGVVEYFAADPHIDPVWTGYWRQQGRLVGWRLNPYTQLYERILPDAQGRLESVQLQSWLIMEGIGNRQLHLYDQFGQLRLTEREAEQQQRLVAEAQASIAYQQQLAAEVQANMAHQQQILAEAQMEAERQQRVVAEAQVEAERQQRVVTEAQVEAERQQRLAAEAQVEAERQQRVVAEAQVEAERQQRLAAEAAGEAALLRAQELEELLRRINQKPPDLA